MLRLRMKACEAGGSAPLIRCARLEGPMLRNRVQWKSLAVVARMDIAICHCRWRSPMLLRVAFGVGLLALGYYVGREMGRNDSLRRELEGGQGRGDLGPEEGPAPPAAEAQSTVDPIKTAGGAQG